MLCELARQQPPAGVDAGVQLSAAPPVPPRAAPTLSACALRVHCPPFAARAHTYTYLSARAASFISLSLRLFAGRLSPARRNQRRRTPFPGTPVVAEPKCNPSLCVQDIIFAHES
jgi:hypothetical protein